MTQFKENAWTYGMMEGQTDPILWDPSGYCWGSKKTLRDTKNQLPVVTGLIEKNKNNQMQE